MTAKLGPGLPGYLPGVLRIFTIALGVGIADRLSKSLACGMLPLGRSVPVMPGIFHITLVFNTGAAFGIFKGAAAFFIVAAVIAILAIAFYVMRRSSVDRLMSFALGLILGGAISNLVDRVRYGYVIDLLDFRVWPVFNIADSCITIGTLILALKIIIASRKDQEHASGHP